MVQRGVGLPVAAAVEAATGGLAGGRLDRIDAAQRGEGGLAVQSVGVVAGGDEQCCRAVGVDAAALEQFRGMAWR